jgi:predicted glutamine amidotransferase
VLGVIALVAFARRASAGEVDPEHSHHAVRK